MTSDGWAIPTESSQRRVAALSALVDKCEQVDPRQLGSSTFTYVDVSAVSNESLSIVAPQLLETSAAPSRARQLLRSGDVLFATIRPSLRRVALVPPSLEGAVASTGYCVLRPKRELVDPDYLYFACGTPKFVSAVASHQKGSSYPAVANRDVLAQKIVIPSLEQQRRIVNVLTSVCAARAAVATKLRALRELRRSASATLFRSSPMWRETRLGSEVTLQRGYDLPSHARSAGVIPVVSSSGITGYHTVAKEKAPGVVIGRYGTLGVVHYIEQDYWPLNTTLFVRDFHGNDPRFVAYCLERLSYQEHNDKTSVPGINRNDLHALNVLWPGVERQKEIVKRLIAVDDAIGASEREAQRVNDLLQAMLASLMDVVA